MASITVENYLKALYTLANEAGEIALSELSIHLALSKPTVHSMVKTLDQQGLVKYERYKPLKLTKKGYKTAALIVRKHRLTEMFLVEKMGFGWEEVHEIAEQVEHIQAPSFFDRMDMILAYPKVDPHGSPIPDKEGNLVDHDYKKLSECFAGDQVRIVALEQSSREFLKYLDSCQIALGTELEIKSVEAFDGSMQVCYAQNPSAVLSLKVCERLLVEKT